MFGWYEKRVLPRATRWVCGARSIERQRRKVVPRARGEVLEIGFGSGFNLPWYEAESVERLVAVDPAVDYDRHARQAAAEAPFEVELVGGSAEQLAFASGRFDSVVVTYALCTIPRVVDALREARRVLRPDGQLLFIEHGRAPDLRTRRWQDRLNPLWRRLGGGCHLNRDIPRLLEAGGFVIADLETLYLPGFRWLNYNYWGSARPGT
jgi:SAM-dependent methyltransferase